MSEKKKNQENGLIEDVKKEKKSELTKTLYTHGKKFVIPRSQSVEDFLREKYPSEYK